MSSSNCCFLTCIQVSQEAGQVVWYSHLFQNFPRFIVIHTVKGFHVVNKAEIDVFLELSCCFDDPADIGNLISGSSAFSKTSLNIWKFSIHVLLKPGNCVVFKVSTPKTCSLESPPGVSAPLMDAFSHVYTTRSCFMEFSPVIHLWVEFHFPAGTLIRISWHPWRREFLPCHHPPHDPHLSPCLPEGHPNSQWHLMPLCHCLCR